MEIDKVINIINQGGVAVIPTDTIYGLVAKASDKKAVERLYQIKGRPPEKPFIVLISSLTDLESFGVHPKEKEIEKLNTFWPGKVSVIFEIDSKNFQYLDRGTQSLAFRYPNDNQLISILKSTGPIVAPSANLSDRDPAETVEDAWKVFGEKVDAYLDGGRLETTPSTLVKFNNGRVQVLREGQVKF